MSLEAVKAVGRVQPGDLDRQTTLAAKRQPNGFMTLGPDSRQSGCDLLYGHNPISVCLVLDITNKGKHLSDGRSIRTLRSSSILGLSFPLDERAKAELMRAMYALGRHADALSVYQE